MFADATGLPILQQTLARTPWVRAEDLSFNDDPAWEYDLALALGYAPRSWDGMWKLVRHPFTFRAGLIITREVVYLPDTHAAAMASDGESIPTRLVAHHCPPGWQLIADYRMTEADPHYFLVTPDDLRHGR